MSLTRKWSLLAAVLVVAIFAAGWVLLISPKRSDAADLRSQANAQEAQNARLVQKLEMLKAQQAELPKQRATLATLRTQIPDNPALPSLIRDLTAAARKVGASIDELTPEPPVAVVATGANGITAPAAASGSTSTDGTSGSTTADSGSSATGAATSATGAAATGSAAPASTLFQVPLEVKVSGSYFEIEQFVNRLEGLERSFLVRGFELKPPDGGGDVPSDTLQLDIQGQVFLAPAATAPAQPTSATSAANTAE